MQEINAFFQKFFSGQWRASRPHSTLLYLKLHSSVLCLALLGGVVGDGLVGAVALGADVGSGAAEGDEVVFH